MDKSNGMKSTLISGIVSTTTVPSTTVPYSSAQGVTAFTMYGTNQSTATTDQNADLWKVYNQATGAVPSTTDSATKLRFRACVMDFVVKNTGAAPMFIDAYFVQCRRSGTTSDPATCWANMVDNQRALNTAFTGPDAYKVTPFSAPGFGRYWFVKQVKRFFIPIGDSISFQIRDAKNYTISGEAIFTSKGLPNITEGVIFVGYGADITASVTGGQEGTGIPTAASYDISCVRTYHYYDTQSSTDAIGYIV